MSFTAAFLLFGLLLIIPNSSGQALNVPETKHGNHNCLCPEPSSESIPLEKLDKVIVILPKDGCKKIELMFSLKDNKEVCVDPKSKWVQNSINDLMRMTAIPTRKPIRLRNRM